VVARRQAEVNADGGNRGEADGPGSQSSEDAIKCVAAAKKEQLGRRPGEAEAASLEDDAIEKAESGEDGKGHSIGDHGVS
jgi:hypothetical protein